MDVKLSDWWWAGKGLLSVGSLLDYLIGYGAMDRVGIGTTAGIAVYVGTVLIVRVVNGIFKRGDNITLVARDKGQYRLCDCFSDLHTGRRTAVRSIFRRSIGFFSEVEESLIQGTKLTTGTGWRTSRVYALLVCMLAS